MPNRFARDTTFEVTLSGTYQVSGSAGDGLHEKVAILVDYTKGNEDTMRMKIEFSDDGNDWFQETVESVAGGVSTVTPVERDFSGSQKSRVLIDIGAEQFRVHVKGTGATPTGGTVKVRYKLL